MKGFGEAPKVKYEVPKGLVNTGSIKMKNARSVFEPPKSKLRASFSGPPSPKNYSLQKRRASFGNISKQSYSSAPVVIPERKIVLDLAKKFGAQPPQQPKSPQVAPQEAGPFVYKTAQPLGGVIRSLDPKQQKQTEVPAVPVKDLPNSAEKFLSALQKKSETGTGTGPTSGWRKVQAAMPNLMQTPIPYSVFTPPKSDPIPSPESIKKEQKIIQEEYAAAKLTNPIKNTQNLLLSAQSPEGPVSFTQTALKPTTKSMENIEKQIKSELMSNNESRANPLYTKNEKGQQLLKNQTDYTAKVFAQTQGLNKEGNPLVPQKPQIIPNPQIPLNKLPNNKTKKSALNKLKSAASAVGNFFRGKKDKTKINDPETLKKQKNAEKAAVTKKREQFLFGNEPTVEEKPEIINTKESLPKKKEFNPSTTNLRLYEAKNSKNSKKNKKNKPMSITAQNQEIMRNLYRGVSLSSPKEERLQAEKVFRNILTQNSSKLSAINSEEYVKKGTDYLKDIFKPEDAEKIHSFLQSQINLANLKSEEIPEFVQNKLSEITKKITSEPSAVEIKSETAPAVNRSTKLQTSIVSTANAVPVDFNLKPLLPYENPYSNLAGLKLEQKVETVTPAPEVIPATPAQVTPAPELTKKEQKRTKKRTKTKR